MLQIVTFFILSWSSGVSQASTGQIQLAWNPVEDSRVARYELHYGSASKSYQSQVQSTTAAVVVAGLESGSTYFFAARACTSDGSLCSAFSNEVVASVPYAPPVAGFSATNLSGVAPLTVTFSDTSSGAISGWAWDFGDGSSSTAASPTHVYGVPGKYNVSLIVTGPGGQDTETRSGYVNVAYPAPIADFNSDVVSGVAPLTVRFSDASSGAVSGWAWDFGDGNSSTEASPTHIYKAPGTYSVSLVVAGPGGQGTETRSSYIQVGSEPIVDVGGPKLDSELIVPTGFADLTSEGVADWVHWGLDKATSVNRKSGASPQIGDLLMIGGTPKTFASTSRLNYAWTDGMPKAAVTTGAGLYIAGLNKGYEVRVPADTNERNLVVYLGGYKTRGQLEVRLSDDSAPAYSVEVEDLKTAFDRRLALSYRAAKPGQELIVRYTQTLSSGNITLQAATLKGNLANQAPVLAAIGDRTLEVGESLTIDINATDEDVSSLVMAASPLPGTATFSDMGNGTGRLTWTPTASDVSTNAYSITFTATDTGGKGLSTSETIAVTVKPAPIVPELTPSLTTPTGTADLTAEGTTDWTHWGIDTASSISRKSGVASQISSLSTVGGTALRFNDSGARLAYSWNDGTPKASATTRAGLYISGLNKGYELKVPADTGARTLTLYLGGYKTRGQLEVRLSDNSAPAYTVAVEDLGTAFDRRVALTYRAASADQQLIVRYMQVRSGGNITLQAATLQSSWAKTASATAEAPIGTNLAGSPQSADSAGVETTGPAIEIGEVEINQEWQRIELQRAFNDPIVVVKALSAYDTEPAVVRVDAIDSKGFWIRVQEWDYLDDAHDLETVSYMVVERGRHELADGTQIEAGSLETGVTQAFQRQSFSATFEEAPVVFAAVTSFNESDAVTARLHNVDSDGFDVGLREQEANVQLHLPERIDYIAWEVSSGVVDGLRYEVGRTGTNVSQSAYNLVYGTTFQRAPVLVADMQTTYENDTAALRWQNLNVESVDLWVQEEQSHDPEVTPVPEDVGYFVADVE